MKRLLLCAVLSLSCMVAEEKEVEVLTNDWVLKLVRAKVVPTDEILYLVRTYEPHDLKGEGRHLMALRQKNVPIEVVRAVLKRVGSKSELVLIEQTYPPKVVEGSRK